MAKNTVQSSKFRLSRKAEVRLNQYLAQIKKGILCVSEMHTHDSAPSLTKVAFEEALIDKILGPTCSAVSLSIKAMAEGLAVQKEQEFAKRKEDIQ